MSEIDSGDLLPGLLREALPGSDCPDPGVFLEFDSLAAGEQARIDLHVQKCPACSAERLLATEFAAGGPVGDEADVDKGDLAYVINHLRENRPVVQTPPVGGATILRHPAWQRVRHFSLPLAAAAAVLLAVTVFLRPGGDTPPPLPELNQSGVLRGTRIEPLAPVGQIDSVPAAFEWTAIDGAMDYYLELRGVDGRILWSGHARDARASLPERVGTSLHPAVTYYWQVEARDADGAILKASAAQSFELRPARDQ